MDQQQFIRTLPPDIQEKRNNFFAFLQKHSDGNKYSKTFYAKDRKPWSLPDGSIDEAIELYTELALKGGLSDYCFTSQMGNRRAGIYLDYDARYLTAVEDRVEQHTKDIITKYIIAYITALCTVVTIEEQEISQPALIVFRPTHEKIFANEGKDEVIKHGAHVYFNGINCSPEARLKAHELMMANIKSTDLYRKINKVTPLHVVSIEHILDGKPLGSSATLPLSSAPGRLVYEDPHIINIILHRTSTGHPDPDFGELSVVSFNREIIKNTVPFGVHAIKAKSQFDGNEEVIVLAEDMEELFIDTDGSILISRSVDECPCATEIIKLLQILQPTHTNDHSIRLKITNAVTHEVSVAASEWPMLILTWFYQKGDDPKNGITWGTQESIRLKIREAMSSPKLCGLGYLRSEARKIDAELTNKIIKEHTITNLETDIMRGYKAKAKVQSVAPDGIAAEMLMNLAGNDYQIIMISGKSPYLGNWYKYSEEYDSEGKPMYGTSFAKWQRITSPEGEFNNTIKFQLLPRLGEVIASYCTQRDKLPEGNDKKDILTKKIGYLKAMEESFWDSRYTGRVFKVFAAYLSNKSIYSGFGSDLNDDAYLTGVHNGVLEFCWSPMYAIEASVAGASGASSASGSLPIIICEKCRPAGRGTRYTEQSNCSKCGIASAGFKLHSTDNRKFAVSRSLGGIYNDKLSWDSPSVKYVMEIYKQILPDDEVLQHRFLTRGAAIFAGGGGKLLEINFGSGSDGKTVLENCELSTGGFNIGGSHTRDKKTKSARVTSDAELTGYAVRHDATLWQVSKASADSHDAGSVFLEHARLAFCAEPKEKQPYIDGQALKGRLSDTAIHTRAPHSQTGKYMVVRAYCVMLSNIPLVFHTMNDGNLRRMLMIPFAVKFYDEYTKDTFSMLKNAHPAKEEVATRMKGDSDVHEALLWIWVQYTLIFANKYNCEITKVSIPKCAKQANASIKLTTDPFRRFVVSKLTENPNSRITLSKFIEAFRRWQQIDEGQKDSLLEKTPDLLHKLCTSFLAYNIIDDNGTTMTAMDITGGSPSKMTLIGYSFLDEAVSNPPSETKEEAALKLQ